jgi:hypothetical protein
VLPRAGLWSNQHHRLPGVWPVLDHEWTTVRAASATMPLRDRVSRLPTARPTVQNCRIWFSMATATPIAVLKSVSSPKRRRLLMIVASRSPYSRRFSSRNGGRKRSCSIRCGSATLGFRFKVGEGEHCDWRIVSTLDSSSVPCARREASRTASWPGAVSGTYRTSPILLGPSR